MYNPISQNVVRQSLRWMGCPKPIIVGKPGPVIEAESGTVMGQICLMFDRQALLSWAFKAEASAPLSHDGLIHCALQNAFCDDIRVQPIVHAPGVRLQAVVLLCSITAKG